MLPVYDCQLKPRALGKNLKTEKLTAAMLSVLQCICTLRLESSNILWTWCLIEKATDISSREQLKGTQGFQFGNLIMARMFPRAFRWWRSWESLEATVKKSPWFEFQLRQSSRSWLVTIVYVIPSWFFCQPIRTDLTLLIRLSYVTKQSLFYQFTFIISSNNHRLL